ncbi:hypothetical protein FJTKL_05053 [Diaporthe vaccinii]|uniref:Uncharacterized protein n=1 Tax=Diaporthe vaccinii TaxID=105482 RepID=A0ABR4EZ39_9PEZI
MTDDINPKSISSKIAQAQGQAQAQAQHTHTHMRHLNAQAQSLPLSPPVPSFAIASSRHSSLQIPDPSVLPRRPLIITGQQANTSRISSITLSESRHYLGPSKGGRKKTDRLHLSLGDGTQPPLLSNRRSPAAPFRPPLGLERPRRRSSAR